MSIILISTAFILFFSYLINHLKKPSNFPPGPQWFPFVGTQLYLKRLSRRLGGLHLALSSMTQKYKTAILGLKLGNEYVVSVSDYSLIREVLIRDDFDGRPDNFFFKLRSFGRRKSGITGSDGVVWHTNRTFMARHLRDLGFGKLPMKGLIQNEVKEIVEFLKHNGSNIQVAKFFAPSVLNILWTLVAGERISQNDTFLGEMLDLFAMRGKVFDITGGILNQYPWLRHILPKWTGFSLIQEINKKLRNMIMNTIKQHYETWTEGKEDDLMYSYISEIKKSKEVFCDEELLVVCFDIFLAGSQTTSGTLELLFYMMLLYPEIQQKVHEEIDKNVEKSADLDYADLKNLPYTNALLLEIQRHLHVLPIIGPRRAMKDTVLGGYNIPEGTTVLIDIHSMHHNKGSWNDPESFRPERFLNENSDLKSFDNFVPFGLGKRRCPGEALAKQGLFYFFVEIMRKFNVSLSPGSKPLSGKVSLGITLLSENYKAKFLER